MEILRNQVMSITASGKELTVAGEAKNAALMKDAVS